MTLEISHTLAALERKIAEGAALDGPGLRAKALPSDMVIAGYDEDRQPTRRAAVLIALLSGKQGYEIIFTKRPEAMKEHPGQISFPGGRQEEGDGSLAKTALREAYEEIGLPPKNVQIIGRLAAYHTITRYEVTPIIGVVEEPFDIKPDPREVEEVFTAPLPFFLDLANMQKRDRIYQGKPRPYYFFDFLDYHIWGATAAMLINFREALFAFTKEADG